MYYRWAYPLSHFSGYNVFHWIDFEWFGKAVVHNIGVHITPLK
jgi:hypothetical protein